MRKTKSGKTVLVKKHKRYIPPKELQRKWYKQIGKSDTTYDKRYKAKKPGWRPSASGNWYFENRKNRSDKRGSNV